MRSPPPAASTAPTCAHCATKIELARRIGMMGQQVSRFASGRVRLTQERLDLTGMLRAAMQQRSREIEARGIEVRQQLRPAGRSSATPR